MKHSVHARSLASLVVALCLLAAPVSVPAKKGDKNYKRGLEAEKAKQWEQAAQEFALAVAANPSDMEYQLHYRRSLFNASQKFMEQGRTLAEQGDYTGAYNAFRQAYGYDPVNELAQAEMARMLRLQREKEETTGRTRTANGRSSSDDGRIVRSSYDGANGANGANGTGVPAANTARAAAAARVTEQLPPTRSEQLRVINYNGDLEGFVRKMAEELEFNVIFDRDFPKRNINVNLRNVTAARALDHVFIAHNLFFQKLDRRTILVADQSKRGQYQQLVLRTFYLTNIDPNNARTLIQSSLPPNSGRQAIVTPNKETNSITVRDTPENVRLIEELITSIDKERAEVVMDVNIYEVSRTDLLTLGNQIGDQASLSGLGGLNPLQILVGGPNGRGGVVDGTGTGKGGGGTKVLADATTAATTVATAIGGSFLLPATRLSAFQSKDNTRLLAHTLVHAFDGEQSTTRIGQKVPVQTASVSPFGAGTVPGTGANNAAANNIFGNSGFPVIQYQDTGLILKFTPQVFPNQDVQVKMEIESNDVIGASTALTPTFSQRSVTGMARIPNNRTMMIASVAQDKESRGRQGLPLLGLIPVLGRLFSTPTRNDSNNDIVITVTPRVLRAATITPGDIRLKPSGTLQAPVSDTLEAVVREAEREDQLAAARLLPTDVTVQLPTAPVATETASAPTTDAEQPSFVPAPKILAAGDGAAAQPFALPVIHVEDVPPPATKPVNPAPGVSAFAPSASTLPAPTKTVAATGTAAVASAAGLPVATGAELYVVAGGSEMRVGQRQRLMIFVKTGTPLSLAAATLKFDPRVLAVRSVTQGSMFGEGATAAKPSITQSTDSAGQLLALVAPPAGTHVTGMGVLLFVEVEALAAGVSAVGFERTGVHLMGADGRGIAAQVSEIRLTVKQ